MDKILANALLPFALFSSAMVLLGCEQAVEPPVQPDEITASKPELNSEQPVSSETAAERKSGNMFYIVRDVADMQLRSEERRVGKECRSRSGRGHYRAQTA